MENKDEYYIELKRWPSTAGLGVIRDINNNYINISKQSYNYISKIALNHLCKIYEDNNNNRRYIRLYKLGLFNEPEPIADLTIQELEDEYFCVHIALGSTYRCDQIDGVRELLEDLNYI